MTQSGLYKITLTEAKNIQINYTTFTITGGQEVILDSWPALTIDEKDEITNFTLTALKEDLMQSEIEALNNSIYGWVAKFHFFDGTKKIVERPFFELKNTDIRTNTSHSRQITMTSWNKQGLIPFS